MGGRGSLNYYGSLIHGGARSSKAPASLSFGDEMVKLTKELAEAIAKDQAEQYLIVEDTKRRLAAKLFKEKEKEDA